MAILDGDIKLLKSEVLDDVPEGGGMATGAAVVHGASNNLFPDISELDRTYGRISLRKVFPVVLTDDVDQLLRRARDYRPGAARPARVGDALYHAWLVG